jgi:hypothetical protein
LPLSARPALADLVDLEVLLARRAAGEAAPEPLDDAPADDAPASWVAALLQRERLTGAPLPGERVVRGHRLAGRWLGLLALVLGALAARTAVAAPADEPINLWAFLGVLVLLQVLLLVLLVLAMSVGLVRGSAWTSALQSLLRTVGRWPVFDGLARRTPERVTEALRGLEQARHRFATRHSLYRDAERWMLFGLAQRCAVLFNLGAVLSFTALVLFTDLVFGWSTTPAEIDGGHLAALVDALAAPWRWLMPDAVPGEAAIEATRWGRIEGFAGDPAEAARHAGGWWSFLLASLVTWGLTPRVLAWGFAQWRLRVAFAAVRFDDVETAGLIDAVRPRAASWSHPDPAEVAGELLPPAGEGGARAAGGDHATVVLWGGWEADDERVRALLAGAPRGWRAEAVLRAGGADEAAGREVLAALAPRPLVVLVEAGEAPDKRLSRFLTAARAALPAGAWIVAGLIELDGAGGFAAVAEDDAQLWRDALARLRDPYLGVEVYPA